MDCLAGLKPILTNPPNCDRRSEPHGSDLRSRDGSSGQKARGSRSPIGYRRLWESAQNIRNRVKSFHSIHPYTFDRVRNFHPIEHPVPKTVKFGFCSSPPRRALPAPPTGTQGEQEQIQHGIGVPPPLVGRPGTSGELEPHSQVCGLHSTTMVRAPGSSGDSGFHRESPSEEAKI